MSFSVPTGNFGDIFAGYIARGMGLPVEKLLVATNNNDILHRFFQENDYRRETLHQTLSPSMDIMVSSNFERLLFDMHERDGAAMAELMESFQQTVPFRWINLCGTTSDSYSTVVVLMINRFVTPSRIFMSAPVTLPTLTPLRAFAQYKR